ncbi:hypothetical protein [Sorangium sp. So ce131]|uniref:hypothetical protein n=1 Tax=Sorangium sp. So ce131 TaxID=3133282 RepID=UPI003F5E37B0
MTGAAGGERSRLVRALALSRRFHLYLARCASPRAADELVAALSAELPRLGRAGVRVVRLEPYGARLEDTPLTDGELADRLLLPLLDPPEELRGAIHLVDASRAAYVDSEAWARLFSLWNEKRNVLGSSRGEVVVMLPAALAPVFAAAAPDVWSIRSGEYVIDEDASVRGAGLEAHAQGSISFVGAARVALPSGMATATGRIDDALLLLRAVSPLALFGGDFVVRPWIEDLLSARAAREISEPTSDDQQGLQRGAPRIAAQRKLRLAEWALTERRFDEVEALCTDVIERGDGEDVELTAQALSGLAIALAARDRATEAAVHGHRALSLIGFSLNESEGARDFSLLGVSLHDDHAVDARSSQAAVARVLRANALVQWCLGHLEQTDRLDCALWLLLGRSPGWHQSHVLRIAERGQVARARKESSKLLRPRLLPPLTEENPVAVSSLEHEVRERRGGEPLARLLAMDLDLLAGDLDNALRHLEQAGAEERGAWPQAHARLAQRCDAALAIIEIARGNTERASKLLARPQGAQTLSSQEIEPEGALRADAFHAYASGVLAMVTGAPEGASTWFERALVFIAEWERSGLDFRSRMRARVAVELLSIVLQPEGDGAVAPARALAGKAGALLGDTAEDHVSRVLAVAAHRELSRRLASAGAGDARAAAQRAAALAQPLGGLDVPAWDELLRIAERSL